MANLANPRPPPGSKRRLLWVAAGLIVVLAAVITVGAVTSGETPQMSALIAHQHRSEEAADRVPVEISNHGDEQVMVARMAVVSSTIMVEPPQDVPIRVKARNSRRIALDHEGSKCPDTGLPSPGPASLRVELTDGQTMTLPLPDPERLLARMTDDDCALDRVFKVTEIEFGDTWRQVAGPDGPVLRGSVVLTRRSDGPEVTFTGPRGSTLIELRPRSGDEVSTLGAGRDRMEVPIEATAARCDPHGMIESKKAFQFPTWAEKDGEEEQYFELRAGADLEKRMRRLVADTCQ